MCMENPIKITSDKVPKYGWKVLEKNSDMGIYFTPFWNQRIKLDTWTKPENRKDNFEMHRGRMSILKYKKDAVALQKLLSNNCLHMDNDCVIVKVLIKQTTKYAYKGEMTFYNTDDRQRCCVTYAVDQIKAVEE